MRRSALLILGLGLLACRESPAGPDAVRVNLAVLGEPIVYAPADEPLAEPLRITAVNAATGSPVPNVQITWRVTQGSISVTPESSGTDRFGVATTSVRQAPVGTYRVSASAPVMAGAAPAIEVRVVPRPSIGSIQPATAAAGATVTITGSNFSAEPDQNAVWFDGVRGVVLSATPTQLSVRVPACLPPRNAEVMVGLGAVISAPRVIATTGGTTAALALAPGQVRLFSDPAELACIRLSGDTRGAEYVFAVHNTAALFAPNASFELRTLTPRPPAAAAVLERAAPTPSSFAEAWELQLRLRERQLGPPTAEPWPEVRATVVPAVGERRDFNVLDRDNRFEKVTAAVRRVTARAIIYVDVAAENAFTETDIVALGSAFDDPIYSTNVDVFGEPSDLDNNQRIIILFTPRINALTPRSQPSFIAGYFYGCDLVARSRCSGSNQGEIFYALVPDPAGTWGDIRTRATVLNSVPPVLAHEFQHMIHFARRGFSTDALWLAEALAHTAEELVADVFAARGDPANSALYRSGNHFRAQQYLLHTAGTSMIAEELPGSIELRGAGWLFLRYLRGHHGGNDLLRRLTATTRVGAANVSAETGQPWASLFTDFGAALFAAGSADVQGTVPARYTFPGFDLKGTMASTPGGFPLRPVPLGWGDVAIIGTVAAAAHDYYRFNVPAAGSPPDLTIVLAGHRGAPFATASGITVSVIRVR